MLRIKDRSGRVVAACRGVRMVEGYEGTGKVRCKVHFAESGLASFDLHNVGPRDVIKLAPALVELSTGETGRVVGVDPACVVAVTGADHDVPSRRHVWLEIRDGGAVSGYVEGLSPAAAVEALFKPRQPPAVQPKPSVAPPKPPAG